MCTPFVSDFSYSGCKMCIPLLGRRFGFRESFFRTVQKVLPRFGGRFLDWPVPQAVFFLQCFWGIHFWAFFAAMCCRLFCGIFGWRVGVLFSLSWNRCCARVFCGLSRVLFFEVFPNCLRGLLVVGSRAAGQTHAALLFFFSSFHLSDDKKVDSQRARRARPGAAGGPLSPSALAVDFFVIRQMKKRRKRKGARPRGLDFDTYKRLRIVLRFHR